MVNLKKLKEILNIKEISKATKSAYVQKATTDIMSKGMDMSRAIGAGDKAAADKAFNKASKRSKNIQNIMHKALYKKEDVEVEENLMLKNPYKGMDKAKLQAKHKSFNNQIADLQNKKMRSNMGAGGGDYDSEISKYKTKLQHVKNAMKEGHQEMCPDECCGKPVSECDCGPDCKYCDCYEKNMKEQKPCWDGYKQVGTKMKNGREVPNCVPEEVQTESKVNEISTDTKKMYVQKATKDIANRGMDRGMAMSRDGDQADKQAKAADKVIKKRQKGITKAVKSMTKNEALEIGTDEIANVYKAMTPGQEPGNQYRSVASVYRNMVKKRTEIERVARSKKADAAGSRGDQQQNS